ncbi:MAG: DNA cytosine methyltransferase [Methylococcales bacterium]
MSQSAQCFVQPQGVAGSDALKINVPDLITKQLKLYINANGKRKITVSTNWLRLFDFEPKSPVIERSLGAGKGIVISRVYDLFDMPNVKKVYERRYKSRKNNPLESQLEVNSQKILNASFPADCERVHITFEHGKVTITPLTTLQERALNNAKNAEDKLSAFVAFSSGVDAHALQADGFSITGLLDYRVVESRDKSDLTETGALNALANVPGMKALINEDIFSIDVQRVAQYFKDSPFMLMSASPQCDDFSSLKNASQKAKDIQSVASTMDMSLDVLNLIEAMNPPVVMLENVTAWAKSSVYELMSLRLRRRGYKEYLLASADARDYSGMTSRKRAYAIFSILDAPFCFEDKVARNNTPIWDQILPYLKDCRDVTHCKSIQDGARIGRLRVITKESLHSPTPVKSQSRQAKDSLVIEHDSRYYWPTEALLKYVLGIDTQFCLDTNSQTIASEIIGQGIDVPLHASIIRSVKKHIESFFNLTGNTSKSVSV